MEQTKILDATATPVMPVAALAQGTMLQGDKFRIDQEIGSGGFGITYLADDVCLERTVVIKECFADGYCGRDGANVTVNAPGFQTAFREIVQMFMREARSIALLRHPNIVDVHQVFEENGTAYMVLELIEGRDLAEMIECAEDGLSPDQIHALLVKVLDAVALVHANGLLHRDISPDNILLDKWGSPVLIDFGAVREVGTKAASSMLVVKDGYSPPEFYHKGTRQGASSDVYALGATMYHLITGAPPPDGELRHTAFLAGRPDPCTPLAGRFKAFDPVLLETVDAAMRVDPTERLQSARAWSELIEAGERKSRVLKMPPRVRIEALSEMVAEVNRDLSEGTALPEHSPRPSPVSAAVAAAYAPPVPDWVAEFNLETAEVASRRPGHGHIARRAARYARYAQREREARERLRDMDEQRPVMQARPTRLSRLSSLLRSFAPSRLMRLSAFRLG